LRSVVSVSVAEFSVSVSKTWNANVFAQLLETSLLGVVVTCGVVVVVVLTWW